MTKTASNNKVSSQSNDFWTSKASQCPHQRLRQALMFNPYSTAHKEEDEPTPTPSPQAQVLQAIPKRRVVESRRPAVARPAQGTPSMTQWEANVRRWKRDFAAFGRTMASFLLGLLSFLTCQVEV